MITFTYELTGCGWARTVIADGANECGLREFATAILAQLTALDTTLGTKGYKQRWASHEFPSAEYRRLAALLAVLPKGDAAR